MKEEKKLDILENAEQSVIDRISSEFPPQDENEKELIFKMSERKFNKNMGTSHGIDEQTVSGVEVYKRPAWQRFLSAAAAVAVISGGAVGTGYALRHFKNTSNVASDAETEDTTQHDIKKTAPFGDFSEFDYKLLNIPLGKSFTENVPAGDTSREILIEENIDWITTFPLYDTQDITPEQRQKIADLFNNCDYVAEEPFYVMDRPVGVISTYTGDGVPEEFAGTITEDRIKEYSSFTFQTGFEFKNDTPYFLYRGDDEVKLLCFMEVGGVDPHGVLIYTHLRFADRDGKLVMTDEKVSCDAWRIDYNYFISSIKEILGDTPAEPEEETTAAQEEETMTEAETAAETENDSFLTLYPSFKEQNWVFSDTNSQQIIETSYEQRKNIYNIINCSRCIFVSKADYETSDIASATPTEHITLSSRDEESLYFFDFSLINGRTYAAFGKYDTEKPDYTDSYYLISDDTEIIQRIKDCMNK
ncbi:MAG: hypothetical protein IKW96_02425 [Ruminococcus sp.]|uniref:hypothetical protein n=1 Tax=Ruminococcus sp. TaxID=41978 RepID=UPI0025F38FD0|nr:hypothetical protein [Ruminococcus sp.]MBR5682127.1 hypothetical protein [Ruminococcus sp.]